MFELNAVLLALKEFRDLCQGHVVHQQGGRYEGRKSLYSFMEAPVLVQPQEHHSSGVTLSGASDCDCRQTFSAQSGDPDGIVPSTGMFNLLCQQWHFPEVDLFATRYNNKLPKSRIHGLGRWML